MGRIWDILPPKKRERKLKPKEKKARRVNMAWLFFLVVIAAFFIAFKGAEKLPTPNKTATATPTSTVTTASSSPAKTQSQMTIKLLNGTGRVEETEKVKNTLQNAGFKVTLTENALNLYDQTVVYFQPAYENYANDLATLLKSYNAKTQKFTQNTQYDIVIVIGSQ